jgi:hypothetical protein
MIDPLVALGTFASIDHVVRPPLVGECVKSRA